MKRGALRHALAVAAGIVLLVAFINLLSGGRNLVAAGAAAAIVIVLLLFEVSHYRPDIAGRGGTWQPTGERFVDPESGRHMEVYFNPQTGERDYRAGR